MVSDASYFYAFRHPGGFKKHHNNSILNRFTPDKDNCAMNFDTNFTA